MNLFTKLFNFLKPKKRDPKTIGKKLIKIKALETGILCEHWKGSDPEIYVRVINYKQNGYINY